MKHVIVGAGISGLTLGWLLQQKGESVTLLEKSARAGGWIETTSINGFLFEQGPRSLKSEPLTLDLIQKLKLETIEANPSANKRYLYTNNKLKQLPLSFLPTLCKAAFKYFTSRNVDYDETIYDFCLRRFGKEATEILVDAMVGGIYAGDTKQLSMNSCFPQLFKKKQKGPLYTLKGGMQTLTDALASSLDIQYKKEVVRITPEGPLLASGEIISADYIHIAMPLATPAVSVATVNLGYKKDLLRKKGFGYLIPSKENHQVLGVVFDSSVFPINKEETRLTVMMGGAHFKEIEDMSPEAIQKLAEETVAKHLGINQRAEATHVRLAKNAIPQYGLGHKQRVETLEKNFLALSPKISLLGNSHYGVSVNDCIKQAYKIYKTHD